MKVFYTHILSHFVFSFFFKVPTGKKLRVRLFQSFRASVQVPGTLKGRKGASLPGHDGKGGSLREYVPFNYSVYKLVDLDRADGDINSGVQGGQYRERTIPPRIRRYKLFGYNSRALILVIVRLIGLNRT
jgi:hypothetical protein